MNNLWTYFLRLMILGVGIIISLHLLPIDQHMRSVVGATATTLAATLGGRFLSRASQVLWFCISFSISAWTGLYIWYQHAYHFGDIVLFLVLGIIAGELFGRISSWAWKGD